MSRKLSAQVDTELYRDVELHLRATQGKLSEFVTRALRRQLYMETVRAYAVARSNEPVPPTDKVYKAQFRELKDDEVRVTVPLIMKKRVAERLSTSAAWRGLKLRSLLVEVLRDSVGALCASAGRSALTEEPDEDDDRTGRDDQPGEPQLLHGG